MKTDISYVCAVLESEAIFYRQGYDEFLEEKKKAIREVEETYLPNTPKYHEKLMQVEKEFSEKVVQLQKDFAGAGMEAIKDLKDLEIQRVQTIDEAKLNKIRAIKDIPMSESELMALAQKFGVKGDFWSSRMILSVAENNGINLEIESSFDTKMAVLNNLEWQINEIIKYYPNKDRDKSAYVRFGYLSDRTIQSAKEMYGGKMKYESDERIAQKAYMTILSKSSDIEKGFAIENTLKNATGEVRNLLLCKLSRDSKSITDFSLELSGAKEEVESFRRGRASRYENARKVIDRVLKATDEETARRILQENEGKEFMEQLVENAKKKSERFREIVELAQSDGETE